jgi:hypothetical protein
VPVTVCEMQRELIVERRCRRVPICVPVCECEPCRPSLLDCLKQWCAPSCDP